MRKAKKIHERKRFGKLKKIPDFLLLPSPLVKWSRQNLALPGENFPLFFLILFFSPKIKTHKTDLYPSHVDQLLPTTKNLV